MAVEEKDTNREVEKKYSGVLIYACGNKGVPEFYLTNQKRKFAKNFLDRSNEIARAVWIEAKQTKSKLIDMVWSE